MSSIIKVDTVQDQSGNNIINESADTITIGASGDTITIPAGATLANSGIITGFESTGIDDNATSTAITIDSSERVGIGATSLTYLLSLEKSNAPNISFKDTSGGTDAKTWLMQGLDSDFRLQTRNDADNGGQIASIISRTGAVVNTHQFYTTDSERMRIDSSGNVGIGTSAPSTPLEVSGSGLFGGQMIATGSTTTTASRRAIMTHDGSSMKLMASGDSTHRNIIFYRDGGDDETMRIDTSGNLLVGKTSSSTNIAGAEFNATGRVVGVRDAGYCATFSRLTDDGVIVDLRQANITEGTISVSGTTVSYNGFTGTHWSRFQDNSTPTILRGTVLETLDEMCDWYNLEFDIITQDENGNDVTSTEKIPHVLLDSQSDGDVITYNHEGTDYQATIVKEGDVKHMMSKVSDTVDAKNVYGLFVAYDLDGEGYNDFYVASVGSYLVRIKSGETIAKGDLLQSNGDGTAKVQSDDNIKSSSFAKVLSTTKIETYDDGSFIVPCSLMC